MNFVFYEPYVGCYLFTEREFEFYCKVKKIPMGHISRYVRNRNYEKTKIEGEALTLKNYLKHK